MEIIKKIKHILCHVEFYNMQPSLMKQNSKRLLYSPLPVLHSFTYDAFNIYLISGCKYVKTRNGY